MRAARADRPSAGTALAPAWPGPTGRGRRPAVRARRGRPGSRSPAAGGARVRASSADTGAGAPRRAGRGSSRGRWRPSTRCGSGCAPWTAGPSTAPGGQAEALAAYRDLRERLLTTSSASSRAPSARRSSSAMLSGRTPPGPALGRPAPRRRPRPRPAAGAVASTEPARRAAGLPSQPTPMIGREGGAGRARPGCWPPTRGSSRWSGRAGSARPAWRWAAARGGCSTAFEHGVRLRRPDRGQRRRPGAGRGGLRARPYQPGDRHGADAVRSTPGAGGVPGPGQLKQLVVEVADPGGTALLAPGSELTVATAEAGNRGGVADGETVQALGRCRSRRDRPGRCRPRSCTPGCGSRRRWSTSCADCPRWSPGP